MSLVVLKIVTLNQCEVIWSKITVVACAASGKKGDHIHFLGWWKLAKAKLNWLDA